MIKHFRNIKNFVTFYYKTFLKKETPRARGAHGPSHGSARWIVYAFDLFSN